MPAAQAFEWLEVMMAIRLPGEILWVERAGGMIGEDGVRSLYEERGYRRIQSHLLDQDVKKDALSGPGSRVCAGLRRASLGQKAPGPDRRLRGARRAPSSNWRPSGCSSSARASATSTRRSSLGFSTPVAPLSARRTASISACRAAATPTRRDWSIIPGRWATRRRRRRITDRRRRGGLRAGQFRR